MGQTFMGLLALSQNFEKRLLASSCLASASLSVFPHGTTRVPLEEVSWNLIFVDFSKTVEKIKI
jgi:hypothetical protein